MSGGWRDKQVIRCLPKRCSCGGHLEMIEVADFKSVGSHLWHFRWRYFIQLADDIANFGVVIRYIVDKRL